MPRHIRFDGDFVESSYPDKKVTMSAKGDYALMLEHQLRSLDYRTKAYQAAKSLWDAHGLDLSSVMGNKLYTVRVLRQLLPRTEYTLLDVKKLMDSGDVKTINVLIDINKGQYS